MAEAAGAGAPARGVWISHNRWPDTRSFEAFGASIARIEPPADPEALALSIYKWVTRCYGRSGAGFEGVKGYELGIVDMLKELHVYGQGLCDKWGRLMAQVAIGAGLQARKVVINGYMQPGHDCTTHTMCELFYRDRDGVERWHWFDPHLGRYVFTRDGSRVASLQDLYEDPSLFGNPSRTSQPFHVRENDPNHYKQWDPADVIKDVRHCAGTVVHSHLWASSYRPQKDLAPGETWTRLWERLDGQFYRPANRKFNQQLCARGYRDSTPLHYDDGSVKDPANYPYWKPYLIQDPDYAYPVKPLGNGQNVFEPDLGSSDWATGAVLPPIQLRQRRLEGRSILGPAASKEMGMVIWRLQSPTILTDVDLEATVVNRESEELSYCGLAVSYDNGETWFGVWDDLAQENRPGRQTIRVNLGKSCWEANHATLHGKYDVLLRFECMAVDPEKVGLESLRWTATTQLHMFAQPMLQPGRNRITVEADHLALGWGLEVAYVWDDRTGAGQRHTQTVTTTPANFEIATAADRPDEIRMRSLTVRPVALATKGSRPEKV